MRFHVVAVAAVGLAALSFPGAPPEQPPAPAPLVYAEEPEPAFALESLPAAEATIYSELARRHTGLPTLELLPLARTIVAEARRHGIEPELVMAVIRVESSGYHRAVSSVGALGLMQLMPGTAEELSNKLDLPWRGPDSLFDPLLNVRLGVEYLSQLSRRYGSVDLALAAYNWGPGRIDGFLRRGDSLPSLYIKQVRRAYEVASARRS